MKMAKEYLKFFALGYGAISVQAGTSSLRAQRSHPEANLWMASSLTLLAMTCWNIICAELNINRATRRHTACTVILHG
jgi:hypothetical protein